MLGISEATFFAQYFEQQPLIVNRHLASASPPPPRAATAAAARSKKDTPEASAAAAAAAATGSSYFASRVDWSTASMLEAIATKELRYSTDANVVRYDQQRKARVPFQTDGVMPLDEVQACMTTGGWSVRFLRPHEHSAMCAAVIRALEQCFACSCGANSYWTPKDSQGFAPHYDDVDVFLLQLEGQKHWRLYPPPTAVDVLSRHSSEDYLPSQLPSTPTHTATLQAGDALYMPRGWVHQGHTDSTGHSLHITFSASQMHAWADLLLRATRHQIEVFAANDVAWRRSVPRAWMGSLGAVNNRKLRGDVLELPDAAPPAADPGGSAAVAAALPRDRQASRTALLKQVRDFVAQLAAALNDAEAIDHAVDMFAQDAIARMQPEAQLGGPHPAASAKAGTALLAQRIAVVHPTSVRLVLSVPQEAVVVYAAQNSVVCGAAAVQTLRFEVEFAPAIAVVLEAFPGSVRVGDLPMPAFEEDDANANRTALAEALVASRAFVLS
jgi:lysine-specific demethylase/histidyl-hydroxylase NO66